MKIWGILMAYGLNGFEMVTKQSWLKKEGIIDATRHLNLLSRTTIPLQRWPT